MADDVGHVARLEKLKKKLRALQKTGENEDRIKKLKKKIRKQETACEGEAAFEVEGVLFDGSLFLVDRASQRVYSSERSDAGDLVPVGMWDADSERVLFDEKSVHKIESEAPSGSKKRKLGATCQAEPAGESLSRPTRFPEPLGKWFPNATRGML